MSQNQTPSAVSSNSASETSAPQISAAYVMGATQWILLFILSAIWGSSFFFYKLLVVELPIFTIVLARVAIAAAALHLFLMWKRDPVPLDAGLWKNFFLMGVLNNVIPFALIVYGETQITSGLAAILNATTPVFTILASRALVGEEIKWNKALGVGLGFMGVVVLFAPQLSGAGQSGSVFGGLAIIGASMSYGLSGVVARRFRGIQPAKVAAGQLSASALMLLPLVLIFERPWTLAMPSPHIWAALIALALMCTALAYILFFRLMQTSGPNNTSLVTLLVPVSAILLGSIFLQEQLSLAALLGMAIIAMGLLCIDGRVFARLTR